MPKLHLLLQDGETAASLAAKAGHKDLAETLGRAGGFGTSASRQVCSWLFEASPCKTQTTRIEYCTFRSSRLLFKDADKVLEGIGSSSMTDAM